jgi:hypothetical protein
MAVLPQAALMAAIVATLFYWPAGIVAALLLAAFGVPLDAVLSFGGHLGRLAGLFAWWLLAFVGACTYTVCVFPWSERIMAWPGNK